MAPSRDERSFLRRIIAAIRAKNLSSGDGNGVNGCEESLLRRGNGTTAGEPEQG
jgi:hypothetical protein